MSKFFNVKFRLANESDLDSIYGIEVRAFAAPWTRGAFQQEFKYPHSTTFALLEEETNTFLGYIIFWIIEDECHILNIAIDTIYQGKGLGSKLMDIFFEELKKKHPKHKFKVLLEVRKNNLSAIKLYEKFNFRFTGIRKNYYANGEDAILMELIYECI